MSWKEVLNQPFHRHTVLRVGQIGASSLALAVLIYLFRNRSAELTATLYFLFAGPILLAAYTWGKEAGALVIVAVVSFFVPAVLGGDTDTTDLVVKLLELVASVLLFAVLAVVGDWAGKHLRQQHQYRHLGKISDELSKQLDLEELIQTILDQTVPLFDAAGGEIVLRDDRTHELRIVATAGVSREAQAYVDRRAYFESVHDDTTRQGQDCGHPTLAEEILGRDDLFLHNQLNDDPRYFFCGGDTPLIRVQVDSVLAAPLRRGSEPIGLLSLFNKSNGGFDHDDADLLTEIAEKAAITLENARLYHLADSNLAQRVEELSLLNRIAHGLVSSLDLDQTLQAISNALKKLFPFATIEICLWEPVHQVMRMRVWSGDDKYWSASDGYYRLGEGYSGWIAQHREPLWIPRVEARQDVQPKVLGEDFPIRSYVGYPMKVGEQLIGTLELFSDEPDDFPTSAQSVLESLCNQAAVAVQNARLYQERQQRLTEMVGLQQISQAMSAVRNVNQVYSVLTQRIAQSMNVELCGVLLYNPEAQALVSRPPFFGAPTGVVQSYRLHVPTGSPIWNLWESVGYWYSNDVSNDPLIREAGLDALTDNMDIHATMLVALAAGGRRFGALQIADKRDGTPFDEGDARLLSILAHQAAVVLENARLYETEQTRRRTMEALQASAAAISAPLNLAEVRNLIAERAAITFGVDAAALLLPTPSDRHLGVEATYGLPHDLTAQLRVSWIQIRKDLDKHGPQPRLFSAPSQEDAIADCLITAGQQSWVVAVPLMKGDTPTGVLYVGGTSSTPPFTPLEMELVSIFGSQACVAIENARLYTQTDERLRLRMDELTILNKIGQELNATLDLEYILNLVLREAVEATTAGHGNLYLMNWETDNLEVRTAFGTGSEEAPRRDFVPQVGTGIVGSAAAQAQPVNVDDVTLNPDYVPVVSETRSQLAVPILHRGIVVGVINLESPQVGGFTEAHMEFLEALAAQAAVAINNARTYEEQMERSELLRHRAEQLSRLFEIGRTMRTDRPLEEILTEVAFGVQESVGFDVALISIREENQQRRIAAAGLPLIEFERLRQVKQPWSNLEALFRDEFRVSDSFFVPYEKREAARHLNKLQLEEGADARVKGNWHPEDLLLVPLRASGEEILGLLSVDRPRNGKLPDRTTIEALEIFAAQAAIAVENARLFEQVRSYHDELERRVEERTVALEKERDRVETLYRISSELTASLDLDRVLNRALALVLDAVQAERSSIFMLDQQTDRLTHRAALWKESGAAAEERRRSLPLGGEPTSVRRGEGLAGWVMEKKQPAIIGDIYRDPRWTATEVRGSQYAAVLAVPLIVSDEALGALLLYHPLQDYFTAEHLRLVEAVAVQVASAVNNAELYSYVFESAERLGRMIKAQQVETAKTEAILEGVADGVMVTDETGVVIRFNAAAERILNTPREQVLGRHTAELLGLYGASGTAWATAIEDWKITPPHFREDTLFAERLEFEERIVSVLLSPVVMHDEFLGTVSLFRDITQEVEVDRAKSEFVSTVSHELRTPMTSIKGYADLLVMGASGDLNEGQQKFLSIIKTNADRLTMLVNDLLDIGRIDTRRVELNLKELDLLRVVRLVIESLRGRAVEKSQTLKADLPSELPPVMADQDRLIQILTNLISNAQQYTPTGGHITVTARLSDQVLDPSMEGGADTRAGPDLATRIIQIDVRDNGIGIAPEDRDKIFERFFRSDHPLVQETTGTGLGLSITKSLIEMQGGSLWVESELGKGSTFSFTLPTASEQSDAILNQTRQIEVSND
jgi:PAS domain S-box-containing protein